MEGFSRLKNEGRLATAVAGCVQPANFNFSADGGKKSQLNRESNVIDTMYDLGSLASTATHSPHPQIKIPGSVSWIPRRYTPVTIHICNAETSSGQRQNAKVKINYVKKKLQKLQVFELNNLTVTILNHNVIHNVTNRGTVRVPLSGSLGKAFSL